MERKRRSHSPGRPTIACRKCRRGRTCRSRGVKCGCAPGNTRSGASATTWCRSTCSTPTCRRTRAIARLTDHLYGGDPRYRLCQEVILGIGGVRMLRALGYNDIGRFHMNEGHASLLTLELANEFAAKAGTHDISPEVVAAVRPCASSPRTRRWPAGHDQFPMRLVARVIIGYGRDFDNRAIDFCLKGTLNMTYLALNLSHYVNGVAKKHGEVSRHMFAAYKIDSITNGVHAAHVDGAAVRAIVRPSHSRLAGGQFQPAVRAGHSDDGSLGGASSGQAGADCLRQPPDRTPAWTATCFTHRLRAARHRLQARRPAVLRTSSGCEAIAATRADPDRLRRQGPSRTTRAARS